MKRGGAHQPRGSPSDKLQSAGQQTRFAKGDPRASEAGKKSARKKQEAAALRDIASKILYSKPKMSDSMREKLRDQMGIDIRDETLLTNASVLLFRLLQSANSGDMTAIRQLFEMAGEPTDSRGFVDRERLALERERIALERERLRLLNEKDSVPENSVPTIIIRKADDHAD